LPAPPTFDLSTPTVASGFRINDPVPVTATSSAWSPQTTSSNTGFSNSAGGSFGSTGVSGFSGNQNSILSSSSNIFSS
jgi:hypothetical protein